MTTPKNLDQIIADQEAKEGIELMNQAIKLIDMARAKFDYAYILRERSASSQS